MILQVGFRVQGESNPEPNLNRPKPTFLQGPYKFYIWVRHKNLQKSVGYRSLRNCLNPQPLIFYRSLKDPKEAL